MLDTFSKLTDLKFTVTSHDFGGIGIDNFQNPLPESTLTACKEADAILLGNLIFSSFFFFLSCESRLILSPLPLHYYQKKVLSVDLNGELILL